MLTDESRSIRLMNTVWADRSGLHDSLTTVADLADWLDEGIVVGKSDLAGFRAVRQALRDLAALVTGDTRPVAANPDVDAAVAEVNRAVTLATTWPQLEFHNGRLRGKTTGTSTPAARALAATAAEAVALFTGDIPLRACYAPACVLYFVKDHPRREWCSPACGNRARAARHYRRVTSS